MVLFASSSTYCSLEVYQSKSSVLSENSGFGLLLSQYLGRIGLLPARHGQANEIVLVAAFCNVSVSCSWSF